MSVTGRDYAEAAVGRVIFAWRRPGERVWDVYAKRKSGSGRRVAIVVGSRRLAADICQTIASGRHIPADLELP